MASDKVEFLDDLPGDEKAAPKVDEKEAEAVSEPEEKPKAKRASPTKKAAKPEVVEEEDEEPEAPKTDNPKLKRLSKYRDRKYMP